MNDSRSPTTRSPGCSPQAGGATSARPSMSQGGAASSRRYRSSFGPLMPTGAWTTLGLQATELTGLPQSRLVGWGSALSATSRRLGCSEGDVGPIPSPKEGNTRRSTASAGRTTRTDGSRAGGVPALMRPGKSSNGWSSPSTVTDCKKLKTRLGKSKQQLDLMVRVANASLGEFALSDGLVVNSYVVPGSIWWGGGYKPSSLALLDFRSSLREWGCSQKTMTASHGQLRDGVDGRRDARDSRRGALSATGRLDDVAARARNRVPRAKRKTHAAPTASAIDITELKGARTRPCVHAEGAARAGVVGLWSVPVPKLPAHERRRGGQPSHVHQFVGVARRRAGRTLASGSPGLLPSTSTRSDQAPLALSIQSWSRRSRKGVGARVPSSPQGRLR